jgi:hypothetical protein
LKGKINFTKQSIKVAVQHDCSNNTKAIKI